MPKKIHFLFRLLTSLIFIYAGIGHLVNPEKVLNRLSQSATYTWLPFPGLFQALVIITGVIMVVAALLLIANIKIRFAALALLLVLVPITLSVQLNNPGDLGPFFKNVAISGSLILLIKIKHHEVD